MWLNKDINYINLALTLEAVAKKVLTLNIVRKKIDIIRLIVNNKGICKGVEAVGGYNIVANKIIVAIGPWTPGLLKISKIIFFKPFFTIISVVVVTMPLNETEFDILKSMPILVSKRGLLYSVNLFLF